jgi:hypothetical protein
MHYHFIEIGTSDFDTEIQKASDASVGLSVEPIKSYLDNLPDKPHVKKINCAISFNNKKEILEIFYITEETYKKERLLERFKLPRFIFGCNSIGDYHPFHIKGPGHEKPDLRKYVTMQKVHCIPISQLFEENYVTSCDYLKIDIEGKDSYVVEHLIKYLKTKDKKQYPNKIQFEANEHCDKNHVQKVNEMLIQLGYHVIQHARLDKKNYKPDMIFPDMIFPDMIFGL